MRFSTSYIIGFSAVVCVVCAVLVAGSAVSLKPMQDRNVLLDRQKNVLAVAGLIQPGAPVAGEEVERLFTESIRARVIDLATGEENKEIDANSFDQRRAARTPETSAPAAENLAKVTRVPKNALVYEVLKDGQVDALILPIEGMGLWSVLYGYIALGPDGNSVRGLTFYEHGETAGLGGEVDNPRWKARWPGRRLFDEQGKLKIEVKKGPAGPVESDPHHVDGLSGATLTSRGVTNMLRFWLGEQGFATFLDHYRARKGA